MNRNRIVSCVIGIGLGAIAASTPVIAGVTVDVLEVGSDVVTTASGSWDLSAWEFIGPGVIPAQMDSSDSWLFVGATASADFYFAAPNFSGPANGFGTGVQTISTSATGDFFGFQMPPLQPILTVPAGYASGNPLSGDAFYDHKSFALLGLTEGVFTWTWDTPDGRGDFFTINVGPVSMPVADLTDFTVVTGTLLGGILADLESSDDSNVHTRSGFGSTLIDLHNMEMQISAMSTVQSPATLDLTIESRISEPAGIAQIGLLNHTTAEFDPVGQYALGNTDAIDTILDINAMNYVNDPGGAGGIELSIKHVVFVPFLAFTFESFVDHVEIVVR